MCCTFYRLPLSHRDESCLKIFTGRMYSSCRVNLTKRTDGSKPYQKIYSFVAAAAALTAAA